MSRSAHAAFALALGMLAAAASQGVHAQKAKDTLRIAFKAPISTTNIYIDPQPETGLTTTAVYDALVNFDPRDGQIKPALAQSWQQLSPTVIEARLRQGVKFHDGSEATAQDVAYTYNYIVSPASKLRFASNWGFMEKAEAVDRYTVRIHLKVPTPFAMARFAAATPIFSAAAHSKLENKADYGRRVSIGTGPYMVESVDSSKGIVLKKFDDFSSPGPWRPKPTIGRIHIVPVPDIQTQVAQLMTAGIDIILDAPKEQADQLGAMPQYKVTPVDNVVYFYMHLDAIGRSGNKALMSEDVRRAIIMAVDRQSLVKNVLAGGSVQRVIDAPCHPVMQAGCHVTVPPPKYDRNAARELLAKAGYPNGFDTEITSIPGAEHLAEAVAGQLRAIGVRAKLDHKTFVAFRDKQVSGKLEILVAHYSAGGVSDVATVVEYYVGAEARDYWRDDIISKLSREAAAELDPAKRKAMYGQIFDRINQRSLMLSIANHPAVLLHTREVVVPPVSRVFTGAELESLRWQ